MNFLFVCKRIFGFFVKLIKVSKCILVWSDTFLLRRLTHSFSHGKLFFWKKKGCESDKISLIWLSSMAYWRIWWSKDFGRIIFGNMVSLGGKNGDIDFSLHNSDSITYQKRHISLFYWKNNEKYVSLNLYSEVFGRKIALIQVYSIKNEYISNQKWEMAILLSFITLTREMFCHLLVPQGFLGATLIHRIVSLRPKV